MIVIIIIVYNNNNDNNNNNDYDNNNNKQQQHQQQQQQKPITRHCPITIIQGNNCNCNTILPEWYRNPIPISCHTFYQKYSNSTDLDKRQERNLINHAVMYDSNNGDIPDNSIISN